LDNKLLSKRDKDIRIKAELVAQYITEEQMCQLFDVSLAVVKRNKRELAEPASQTAELLDTDEHVLRNVVDEVRKYPDVTKEYVGKVEKVVNGVTELKTLESEFQDTARLLLGWANDHIPDAKPSEWKLIAGTVGELHEKIFAKGGTTVNVQQNNGGFSDGMVN